MTHRYISGGCIHITGAPGPPSQASQATWAQLQPPHFLADTADGDEEILMGPEPDDLGDLMQEMREGGAWAEGLAMESDLGLCPAPSSGGAPGGGCAAGSAPHIVMGIAVFGSPASRPQSAAPGASAAAAEAARGAQPAAADGSGGGSDRLEASLQALAAMSQQHQLKRESVAEQEAAVAGLQPALRALLMHPGAAGVGQRMIPVGVAAALGGDLAGEAELGVHPGAGVPAAGAAQCGSLPPGMSCAASLAAVRPDVACPSGWPPPPLGTFYSVAPPPPPPPLQQGQQTPAKAESSSPYYAMPVVVAPQLPSQSPSPFLFYQNPPFVPPQQAQQMQGMDAAAMFARMQQQQAQQVQAAQQQQAAGQAGPAGMPGMPPMFPPGSASFPPMPLPQPNSSGSGNASDGTTLRLRSSFESDSGSQQQNCSAGAGAAGTAAAAAAVPQLCSAPALAAFDQAAFDQQPCGGFDWSQQLATGGGGGGGCAYLGAGKCMGDAPSDSSDCEDHGDREGEGDYEAGGLMRESSAQVVPNPMCFPCDLPLPIPAPPLPHVSAFASANADLPPLPPAFCGYYDSPAAQTARLARRASLERYRLKKARRGTGKKIRYQARKINADKRPRIKGRFVKAGEAADILAAAAAAAAATDVPEAEGNAVAA